jgi:TP901 family phage tail tape measure protein
MRLTQAVTGATGAAFERLTAQAKYLGRTTSYTASQVASAMVELGRAGFTPAEIERAIAPLLNMARATGTDLAEAANIASGTLRAFNMDASEMTHVADVMTAAANKSAQTLSDLGESMKYAAPIAADFGMSIEDAAKAIATMANYSIRGSMAGTSLRMVLLQLSKADIRERLQAMGVEVSAVGGGIRNLADIMQDLRNAMESLPQAEQLAVMGELFGTRAVSGGIKLTKAAFQELNRAIDNAAGTAERTAKTMDAGIGGALRIMWSAVEGSALAFANKLAPAVTEFARTVTAVLGPITEFISRHKVLVQVIAGFAAVMTVLGTAMLATSATIWVVIKAVTVFTAVARAATVAAFMLSARGIPALVGLGKAVVALGVFLVSNPIVLALTGIAIALGLVIHAALKVGFATAALRDKMDKLHTAGEERRQQDKLQLERLQQLSEKQSLTNEEIDEAAGLARTLNRRYDGLRIVVNRTTGAISGLGEAQGKANEAMRKARLGEIERAISEARRNMDILEDEMRSIWRRPAGIRKLAAEHERQALKIRRLRAQRLGLAAAEAGPGTAGEPAADIKARIDAGYDEARLVDEWTRRTQQLRIAGIADEHIRRIAEIQEAYDYEVRQAGKSAAAVAQIEAARAQEVANANAAHARAQTELIMEWDRRVRETEVSRIHDTHRRHVAEINARYNYEIARAEGNAEIIKRIQLARQNELDAAAEDALEDRAKRQRELEGKLKDTGLAKAIEAGTAEAYSTVVKREEEAARETARHTKDMVAEQRETNKTLRDGVAISNLAVVDLGLT